MKDTIGKYKGFVVCGDTHGNHNLIKHRIKSRQWEGETFFHVGDFGVGFAKESDDKAELLSLNKFLKSRNCHLYVIRGNHDNPIFFNGTYDFSNLHLMPDYSVVEVNGDKVLMVGGAISVDRKPRKDDMQRYAAVGRQVELYWHDEGFNLDEEKLKEISGVRYVITHSSPKFAFPINDQSNAVDSHGPFVQRFAWEDYGLKDDLNKERNDITKMWEILQEKNDIERWWYGHYHTSKKEFINNTEFVLLDINEFYQEIQEVEQEKTEDDE